MQNNTTFQALRHETGGTEKREELIPMKASSNLKLWQYQ